MAVRDTSPLKAVKVLPEEFSAVKVMVNPVPAVAEPGALTTNRADGGGLTTIKPLVCWIAPADTVSVTVSAVASATFTAAVPLVNSMGDSRSTVWPSLLVIVALASKSVTGLPNESTAVTVMGNPVEVNAVVGAITPKLDTGPGLTIIAPLVPSADPQPAVMVDRPAIVRLTVATAIPSPKTAVTPDSPVGRRYRSASRRREAGHRVAEKVLSGDRHRKSDPSRRGCRRTHDEFRHGGRIVNDVVACPGDMARGRRER